MNHERKEPNQDNEALTVKLSSFGFKNGSAPQSNLVYDVRFLKNPYWEEHLRHLTGLDQEVREYVIEQKLAQDALERLMDLLDLTLPAILSEKSNTFSIALGCTGGQHRSTAMVEELSRLIREKYPQYEVVVEHRELMRRKPLEQETTQVGKTV